MFAKTLIKTRFIFVALSMLIRIVIYFNKTGPTQRETDKTPTVNFVEIEILVFSAYFVNSS